jgi:hypothetical protein
VRTALVPWLVLVAAGACGGSTRAPGTPAAPSVSTTSTTGGGHVESRCELTPEAVRCHATNLGGDYTVACVEPFLGVKETGQLLNGKRRWCSAPVAPGATVSFDALVGVRPVDHCGAGLDGCALTMFSSDSETVAQIAAFARALDAGATRPGPTQPTMAECDDARRAWLAAPELAERYAALKLEDADLIGVFCKLHIPREQVRCFARSRTEEDVEACVPDE